MTKKRQPWNRAACCGRFFSLKDLRYKRVEFHRYEYLAGEDMEHREDEWYEHRKKCPTRRKAS